MGKKGISIPCGHEPGQGSGELTVLRDYYPLSRDEIKKLLDMAASDPESASEIQVRLVQGIKGMTCPRPVTGPVAQKMGKLERIFVDRFHLGGTPDLVEAIMMLMN